MSVGAYKSVELTTMLLFYSALSGFSHQFQSSTVPCCWTASALALFIFFLFLPRALLPRSYFGQIPFEGWGAQRFKEKNRLKALAERGRGLFQISWPCQLQP